MAKPLGRRLSSWPRGVRPSAAREDDGEVDRLWPRPLGVAGKLGTRPERTGAARRRHPAKAAPAAAGERAGLEPLDGVGEAMLSNGGRSPRIRAWIAPNSWPHRASPAGSRVVCGDEGATGRAAGLEQFAICALEASCADAFDGGADLGETACPPPASASPDVKSTGREGPGPPPAVSAPAGPRSPRSASKSASTEEVLSGLSTSTCTWADLLEPSPLPLSPSPAARSGLAAAPLTPTACDQTPPPPPSASASAPP